MVEQAKHLRKSEKIGPSATAARLTRYPSLNQQKAATLLLVRHGESETNAANVFTGWSDPLLTRVGEEQARQVGLILRGRNLDVDRVFSSTLKRSIATAKIILDVLATGDISIDECSALNERDYGDLTGLDKAAAGERWGGEQVRQWRRSYAIGPPGGESLRDTGARVLAYYIHKLLPAAMQGGTTLVVSHGNTLRALIMALDGINAKDIEHFELSTGETHRFDLARDTSIVAHEVLSLATGSYDEQ